MGWGSKYIIKMRFWDKVSIELISWSWGNWCVSWRREKYVPCGWPNGWDGGRWGSIFFVGDKKLNSLRQLHYRKIIKARKWENWQWSTMCGKDADDIEVIVPLWTIVSSKNNGNIIWQIIEDWDKISAVKWWLGGRGNPHFKSSISQYPNFAMNGEPWEKQIVEVELQLIWDVSLIWFPSVWKSSIINTLSNTKVKVADYSFTTLVPNLWIVEHKEKNFIIIDIPWLIEWASQWKWLWNDFLRHIVKSRVWSFVLDISRYNKSFEELSMLKIEIEKYITNLKSIIEVSEKDMKITYKYEWNCIQLYIMSGKKILFKKAIFFLINKIDLINDEEIISEFLSELSQNIQKLFFPKSKAKKTFKNIYLVSAWNKVVFENYINDINKILKDIWNDYNFFHIEEQNESDTNEYIKDVTKDTLDSLIVDWKIKEEEKEYTKVFEIFDPTFTYFTYILPWGNIEAEHWFWQQMIYKWVTKILSSAWVQNWDHLKVKSNYAGVEDMYVVYRV